MTPLEFARDKLRAELNALNDEHMAMVALLGQMNRKLRGQFEARRANISSLSKQELRRALVNLKSQIRDLRSKTGASRRLGTYAALLRTHPMGGPGQAIMLPAYVAVELFRKYPFIADLLRKNLRAPHTHIELDPLGQYEPQEAYQFFVLEAVLFEDMCFYWNEACGVDFDRARPHAAKRQIKSLGALHRAAVSSAFYMVEAYCNGIALEVLLTREDVLTDRELEMIREWDSKKSRPRYVNIRDKLLHYPRLLVGASAPLLQENNCPELEQFLTSSKQFRDAIVHASPRADLGSIVSEKMRLFLALDREACEKAIDSAIRVIQRIGDATGRAGCLFWLRARSPDGRFDDSVFE
jgi:hypothetical protein